MGTFDLEFNPRTTDAISGLIKADADEFERLRMRVLGQSEDLGESFDSGASAFTDGIGWSIHTASEEEIQQWRDVAGAVEFCACVTRQWGDHVLTFNLERNALISEWNEFKEAKEALIPDKYVEQIITDSYPEAGFLGLGDGARARELYEALLDKLENLNDRAQDNYETLQDNGDECGDMLREGPTPENVRLLMESGHANWFFYNLDPEQYAPPIDLSPDMADDWAEQLEEYWSGEREMDDNYESLMLIMGMLASRARIAQEGIGDITEDEMSILENFYSALEEARAGQGGVVSFPDYLPPRGMDQEESDRVMGIIGDGLIMLSNEDFGGGYDLLPESVRHTANGYFLDPEYLSEEWVGDMRNLAKIFEHVDSSMSPGEELGGALHTSIGVYLADGGPVNFDYDGFFSETLEIAYRNEDLNLSLLDGSFEHPSVEDVSSITVGSEKIDDMEDLITKTMASLYSHDWDDDGKAMSLLTDWIHADAPDVPIPEGEGTDLTVEQEKAVEGLEAFMRRMEDDDFFQAVQATGNSAEDVDDVDGVDWENVSAGHLNPELAMGWAELFSAYIDSFGDAANIPDHEKETSWNPESGAFEMSQAGRLRFAELIVADEDAAARLASEVVRFGIESVEEVGLTGSGEQAQRAGILRGLLEEALEREGENRGDQHDETAGYKNKIAALGVDIAAGQAADMGVPSPMAEFLKFQAKEALEVPGKDGSPSIDMSVLDEMVIQGYVEIYTLTTMANNDEETLWKVFEDFPEIVETESVGGQEVPVRISEDPDDWAVTLGRQSSFSQDAHQLVSDEKWIHGDMNAGDVYAIFDRGYERFSDSWSFVDR